MRGPYCQSAVSAPSRRPCRGVRSGARHGSTGRGGRLGRIESARIDGSAGSPRFPSDPDPPAAPDSDPSASGRCGALGPGRFRGPRACCSDADAQSVAVRAAHSQWLFGPLLTVAVCARLVIPPHHTTITHPRGSTAPRQVCAFCQRPVGSWPVRGRRRSPGARRRERRSEAQAGGGEPGRWVPRGRGAQRRVWRGTESERNCRGAAPSPRCANLPAPAPRCGDGRRLKRQADSDAAPRAAGQAAIIRARRHTPPPTPRGQALRVDPDGLPDPVPFFCPARFSGAGERHAQSCGRRRHRVTVSGGGRALTAIGRGRDGGGADLQFTCPDPRAGSGPRAPGPRPRVSGRSAQSRSGGSESAGSAPHGLGRRPNALLAAWGSRCRRRGACKTNMTRMVAVTRAAQPPAVRLADSDGHGEPAGEPQLGAAAWDLGIMVQVT